MNVQFKQIKEKPIFSFFLGKTVLVEAEGYDIIGKLIRYQLGSKNPHKPTLLILKNMEDAFIIVRNWNKISSLGKARNE
jgi:hypothetical protein